MAKGRSVGAALAAALIVTGLAIAGGSASAHTPHDEVEDLAISPDFATDTTIYSIVHRRLNRSTDGGTTWHPMVNGIDGQPISVVASPADPDLLFVTRAWDGISIR